MAIIVHKNKLAAESSYIDWNRVEREWVENCAAKMCLLDNSAPVQKQLSDVTRQNGKLEALLEKLPERLT